MLLLLQGHLHIPGARRSRLFPDDLCKEIPPPDRRLLQAGKDFNPERGMKPEPTLNRPDERFVGHGDCAGDRPDSIGDAGMKGDGHGYSEFLRHGREKGMGRRSDPHQAVLQGNLKPDMIASLLRGKTMIPEETADIATGLLPVQVDLFRRRAMSVVVPPMSTITASSTAPPAPAETWRRSRSPPVPKESSR